MLTIKKTLINNNEFILLLLLLQKIKEELNEAEETMETLLVQHIREQRRLNRSLPRERNRVSWDLFSSNLSDKHFRRMFRMSLQAFSLLCSRIEEKISEEAFHSEEFLLKNGGEELILGEVKVTIMVRMLAGGSYLDLVPLFDLCKSHLYNVFSDFLSWIRQTLEFPLVRWIRERNWQQLIKRANEFAEKSEGIFYGPFAANDGLACRIRCPSESEVLDPRNYYCRKGFYALNVQAMCDKRKYFLWAYPSNKGSTHDSAAFQASRLYKLLKEVSSELQACGLFVDGDSAYTLLRSW
jgi:DDE superfamily endonuclease